MTNGTHTEETGENSGMTQTELPLSQVLRSETRELHFLANQILDLILVKRRMMVDTYGVFLGAYHRIYLALEEGLESAKEQPFIAPIHLPQELNRQGTLEEDLLYFLGEDWGSKLPVLPSVSRYVERLRGLSADKPELLIAHSYVRYMGDLAGSQVIPKVIRHLYKLPNDGSGIRFYDFSHIQDLNSFKASYKARMDSLKMTGALKKELAEEAVIAFQLNIDVMKEVDGTAPSRGMHVYDQVERACSFLVDGETGLPFARTSSPLARSSSLRVPRPSGPSQYTGILRRPEVDASGKVVPFAAQRLARGHSVFHRSSLAMAGFSMAASTFSPWSPRENQSVRDSKV